MTLRIPGGQVAHAVHLPVSSSPERPPALTREGLLEEYQLATLLSNHPEQMRDILHSAYNFGEAQLFADGLRELWDTMSPDQARDSILMLCAATIDFHNDFESLLQGPAKEQSAYELARSVVETSAEKVAVLIVLW